MENVNISVPLAERKNSNIRTGLPVIIINIILGSVLFADLNESIPVYIKWGSAILAFIAALFGGFQTYFKYQRNFEMHNKLGNDYLAIEHELYKLFQSNEINKESDKNVFKKYDKLDKKYHSIIRNAMNFPTCNKDFKHAIAQRDRKVENDPDTILK